MGPEELSPHAKHGPQLGTGTSQGEVCLEEPPLPHPVHVLCLLPSSATHPGRRQGRRRREPGSLNKRCSGPAAQICPGRPEVWLSALCWVLLLSSASLHPLPAPWCSIECGSPWCCWNPKVWLGVVGEGGAREGLLSDPEREPQRPQWCVRHPARGSQHPLPGSL